MASTSPGRQAAGPPAQDPVVVRDLHERSELEALIRAFGEIWTRPDGCSPLQLEVLRALTHAGGMVLGAWQGDRLVGGAVGFVGVGVDGALLLHSHIVGVLPAWQGRQVGRAVKWYQRRWCLARGIPEIQWTFDPLVRRNAWFNVSKLGAVGSRYYEDFYGAMPDGLNAGLPTDRVLVRWVLGTRRVAAAESGTLPVPDGDELLAATAVVLDTGADGEPCPRPAGQEAPTVLARVPADVSALDRGLAGRWRLALRAAVAGRIGAGMTLTAVTRDGWYVLTRDRPDAVAP